MLSTVALSVNQEIKTGTLPLGISEVAVSKKNLKSTKLEPCHVASLGLLFLQNWKSTKLELTTWHLWICCFCGPAQFHSFKDSTKGNNLEAFSSVKSMLSLQCLEFLSQFFRKLEWLLLYTHYTACQIKAHLTTKHKKPLRSHSIYLFYCCI